MRIEISSAFADDPWRWRGEGNAISLHCIEIGSGRALALEGLLTVSVIAVKEISRRALHFDRLDRNRGPINAVIIIRADGDRTSHHEHGNES
jgi:hypothetical protein